MAFSDYFIIQREVPYTPPERPAEGSPCQACGKPGLIVRKYPNQGARSPLEVMCRDCFQTFKVDHEGWNRIVYKSPEAKRVREIVDRINVKTFPVTMRISVSDGLRWGDTVGLSITMLVPDRADPTTYITAQLPFNVHHKDTDPAIVRTIRDRLREIVLHELDEHIRVDGQLAFDPHDIPPAELFFGSPMKPVKWKFEATMELDMKDVSEWQKALFGEMELGPVGKIVKVETAAGAVKKFSADVGAKRKGPPKGAKESKESWREAQRKHSTRFARGPAKNMSRKR